MLASKPPGRRSRRRGLAVVGVVGAVGALGIATALALGLAGATRGPLAASAASEYVRAVAGTPVTDARIASTTSTPPIAGPTSLVRAPGPAPAPPAPAPPAPAPPPPPAATDCAAALAYLATHAAPGFAAACSPGSALGHYGFTCLNVAGMCPNGARLIRIACPAPFVYMNEAHNSWTVIGKRSGIDPYGQGTPAEQAVCNGFR